MAKKVTPGVNPKLVIGHYSEEERKIITNLGREWYVTNGGEEIKLGKTSTYRYLLMRPIDVYSEMFNLEQEIVVVFSPYDTLSN
ncbi:MAG: hypothetical protein QGI51_04140 [Dehalococcoidales bacterium]|mgnify:CR=1 FL=1|jgi:hypothetical protein|nr:hypothetical protein [Dehalococcoidales bacterium]